MSSVGVLLIESNSYLYKEIQISKKSTENSERGDRRALSGWNSAPLDYQFRERNLSGIGGAPAIRISYCIVFIYDFCIKILSRNNVVKFNSYSFKQRFVIMYYKMPSICVIITVISKYIFRDERKIKVMF